ncbi:hypothetical protein [Alloactinosynnema sp. L-07]|uniref:DUF397 domain-containing protein n=1 Tax=Alloactinosynnema sp. L-07 TaxID=1653480 RepID=UPI00065F0910|nr:DUF397 domain-containing protein [Alloactinosynnema sp. L-07]CRK58277.1 hypothetical protein [Alloactinosynnema sp. L-07]
MHGEWRKSTFSNGGQPDCVEVAFSALVRLRDSKNPDSGVLAIPATAWHPHRLAVVRRGVMGH